MLRDRVAELFVEMTWLLRMSLINPFISAIKVLQCGNPAFSLSEPSFLSDLSKLQDLKPTLNELQMCECTSATGRRPLISILTPDGHTLMS